MARSGRTDTEITYFSERNSGQDKFPDSPLLAKDVDFPKFRKQPQKRDVPWDSLVSCYLLVFFMRLR